ncbi:MAG: hypothetical protein LBI36_04400, partial [Oscillospiraceae bacterium]|jgi:hypothetical protein|nr:hypothetical protein [Oscillospiraceae bacterium]
MFPATDAYIVEPYTDKTTKREVRVLMETEKDIIRNAEDVLRAYRRNKHLLFADVDAIYNGLENELARQPLPPP